MKTLRIYLMLLLAGTVLLAACKKNGQLQDQRNVLAVTFNILSVGTTGLQAKIDTFKIDIPSGRFDLSNAYALAGGKQGAKLTITEKGSGKLVMEKELNKADGRAFISFFYMNGAMGTLPTVAPVETGKIKISYMFLPTVTKYAEPVDIVLGKYYLTPRVFEEIGRIKNVKAGEFTETVTIATFPTAGHVYNGQTTSATLQVYIYKAGTNTLYVDGTGYTWNPTGSSAPKPSSANAASKLYIFSEAPSNFMAFSKNFEI